MLLLFLFLFFLFVFGVGVGVVVLVVGVVVVLCRSLPFTVVCCYGDEIVNKSELSMTALKAPKCITVRGGTIPSPVIPYSPITINSNNETIIYVLLFALKE